MIKKGQIFDIGLRKIYLFLGKTSFCSALTDICSCFKHKLVQFLKKQDVISSFCILSNVSLF